MTTTLSLLNRDNLKPISDIVKRQMLLPDGRPPGFVQTYEDPTTSELLAIVAYEHVDHVFHRVGVPWCSARIEAMDEAEARRFLLGIHENREWQNRPMLELDLEVFAATTQKEGQ